MPPSHVPPARPPPSSPPEQPPPHANGRRPTPAPTNDAVPRAEIAAIGHNSRSPRYLYHPAGCSPHSALTSAFAFTLASGIASRRSQLRLRSASRSMFAVAAAVALSVLDVSSWLWSFGPAVPCPAGCSLRAALTVDSAVLRVGGRGGGCSGRCVRRRGRPSRLPLRACWRPDWRGREPGRAAPGRGPPRRGHAPAAPRLAPAVP